EEKAGRDSKRWERKNLNKASNQVLGSIKRLQKSDILVSSPSRGEIIFKKESLQCHHGIVILDYKDDPFIIDNSLPRRYANISTIHYFSHEDFVTLCQQLMTLPDLIEYLNERAKIPVRATPKLNNENDAYAYYCTHKGKFSSTLKLDDYNGQWERLTVEHGAYFNEKIQEDNFAKFFTRILKEMQLIDPLSINDHPEFVISVKSKEDKLRVKTTRILNRLRRLHRREIIKGMFDKMELADKSPLGFNYFAYRTEDVSIFYLFLASRHIRKERMEELTEVAYRLNNITDAECIIGIATENYNTKSGRSFDFIMLDGIEKDERKESILLSKESFGNINPTRIYDFPKDKPVIDEI
ncbi:MAG: hypothetical protein IIB40_12535, partial [Candidatus Marinimicrobia bacterium]|nr:hypothetical protein [Candidatus Neomarinimicrobiota bacterium]